MTSSTEAPMPVSVWERVQIAMTNLRMENRQLRNHISTITASWLSDLVDAERSLVELEHRSTLIDRLGGVERAEEMAVEVERREAALEERIRAAIAAITAPAVPEQRTGEQVLHANFAA